MRLISVLFVLGAVMMLGACEGDQEREPVLSVAWDRMHETLYVETFEYSQIKLRYRDARAREELITLEPSMVIEASEIRFGANTFRVRVNDVEMSFTINLSHEPTVRSTVVYQGKDTMRDDNLFVAYTENNVPQSSEYCEVLPYDPPVVEGYVFSHFDPPIGTKFTSGTEQEVYLMYEPVVLDVVFYDHEGTIIETVEVYYGDSLDDYTYDFPQYVSFSSWDQDLTAIQHSLKVHPNVVWTTYNVWFYDHNDEFLSIESVKHGHSATPPEPPEVPGYTFIEWSESFDNVTSYLYIDAIYERDMVVAPIIDDALISGNYTIEIFWENVPYGDGTVTHRFEVDDHLIKADYYGEFYLVQEAQETFIIDTHEFDDHANWYKTEYWGETLETMVSLDFLKIESGMLTYEHSHYSLDSTHYETIFGANHTDVIEVILYSEDSTLIIDVEWRDSTYSTLSIFAIGETEVILPEYIDET